MGAKLNLQQMPSTPGFLECWEARPGHVWLEADFTALEPHVLAYLSRDEKLLSLYGPNPVPGDIYLLSGVDIPGYGEQIREYYDPRFNPTWEDVSRAKKALKQLRKVLKIVYLSWSYGAGPRKIHQTLVLAGEDITLDEVYVIWQGMNNAFAGVKQYEKKLHSQWRKNKGFVLNALGRPMCVAEDKLKDCLNRAIQGSGHDCLIMFLAGLNKQLVKAGVQHWPVVWDLHDQYITEILEQSQDVALEAHHAALAAVNQQLGWDIKLKAEPQIAYNFAQIKCEE